MKKPRTKSSIPETASKTANYPEHSRPDLPRVKPFQVGNEESRTAKAELEAAKKKEAADKAAAKTTK